MTGYIITFIVFVGAMMYLFLSIKYINRKPLNPGEGVALFTVAIILNSMAIIFFALLALLFIDQHNDEQKSKPKFEQVHEPLYRKIP